MSLWAVVGTIAPNTYKEYKVQERKKLGLPVTEDMRPDEAFTLKAWVDELTGHPEKPFMWYSLKDLMVKVSCFTRPRPAPPRN